MKECDTERKGQKRIYYAPEFVVQLQHPWYWSASVACAGSSGLAPPSAFGRHALYHNADLRCTGKPYSDQLMYDELSWLCECTEAFYMSNHDYELL